MIPNKWTSVSNDSHYFSKYELHMRRRKRGGYEGNGEGEEKERDARGVGGGEREGKEREEREVGGGEKAQGKYRQITKPICL